VRHAANYGHWHWHGSPGHVSDRLGVHSRCHTLPDHETAGKSMTLARFYLHGGQVIMPTVAQTEAGFYTDVEPVSVVDIRDAQLVKESMQAIFARPNPQIPTPAAPAEPGSVVLDALGLKKWIAFEKHAVLYTVHRRQDDTVVYATGRGADGMWIRRKDREN